MKRFFSRLIPTLLAFAALACQEKEVLVERITIEPEYVEIFEGDFAKFSVSTFPHFAANEDELAFSVSDPTVALCKGASVTGLNEGSADFVATCGDATASRPVRVYKWRLSLDGLDYGVSRAEATFYRRSGNTPQELEIRLTHAGLDGNAHRVEFRIPVGDIGAVIDFNEPGEGASALGCLNDAEAGFAVYRNYDGSPTVCNADWSAAEGVRLISGILTVDETGTNRYRIKGRFTFTNGYAFGAQWEGQVSPKYK